MSSSRFWAVLLLAGLANVAQAQDKAPAQEEEGAGALLSRMAAAVHFLDYEGSFVYLQGGAMEALRIVHTEQDGYEREQLLTLTGPAHQIVRDNYTMTRFQPERNQLAVDPRNRGVSGGLLTDFDPERVARSYDFRLIGDGRYAGRITRHIELVPRDALRYRYRLHIDAKYAIPLKFDVLEPTSDRPVSQLMFTDIRIRHESPQSILAATTTNEDLQPPPREPYSGPWRFTTLPEGFELEYFDMTGNGTGGEVEHFVLFDGMASVSVYIEPDSEPGFRGRQRKGTLGVLGASVDGHQITLVGEVPDDALELILKGLVRMSAVEGDG